MTFSSDSTGQPPLLVIACDFPPSRAIGARRVAAIVHDLAAHGIASQVISAFGNVVPLEPNAVDGMTRIWVPKRAKLLLPMLVKLKGALRNLLARRRSTVPADSGAIRGASAPAGAPPVPSLPVRLAILIDLDKRWSLAAARRGCREGRASKPFAVFASGPPMSGLIAAQKVARTLGAPLLLDLRDPWLTNFSHLWYSERSIEARVNAYFERRCLTQAAAITTATEGIAQQLRSRYPALVPRIHVVRNGYDGDPAPRLTNTGRRLDILFAGELYLGRDPFPFLEAVARLLRRPEVDASKVRVTFVGSCDSYDERSLQDWVTEQALENVVSILARVPYETIVKMSAQATVLLNLAQHALVMIPAKAYEHMAAGREVLLISETTSDVYQLFHGIDGVHCVDADDTLALDARLVDLYQRHVLQGECSPPTAAAAQPFARSVQQQIFRKVLAQCGLHQL